MKIESILADICPDIVVNAAAYTAVDKAESEPERAYLINEDGPKNLALCCSDGNIPLFHISTDYVFDGGGNRPYKEDDTVNPISIYGKSKEAGERRVRELLEQHLILRTSWVLSAEGQNFVRTMLKLGQSRDSLRVVDDQRGGPTSARSIASTILVLCEKYAAGDLDWGTYHFSQGPGVSWFEFANEIFRTARDIGVLEHKVEVAPVSSAEYPTPVKRPKNSLLDCARITSIIGEGFSDWRADLADVIRGINCH